MNLIIVESPTKAKTISRFLGSRSGYTIKASVGHIRDLPKSNKDAIDIEGGFVPRYEISRDKDKVIDELTKLAKKAETIILAPDPDREGEAIAWHLAEILKKADVPAKKMKRVVFHEITKNAITEALAHPKRIDQNLRKAQEARRVLDRLVGYDLSGVVWKKVRYGLSAGRVQSPALRILVEREKEIQAFKPESYWTLNADFHTKSRRNLTLECTEEPRKESTVKDVIEKAKKYPWKILSVNERKQKRSPRPPFTTSTLQQTASSRLGMTPSRTMRSAQRLYEAGYITYMRTDSTILSEEALTSIQEVVTKNYGAQIHQLRRYKTSSKNAQEAHEAIRPTDPKKDTVAAGSDEQKLYLLIRARAIASQMIDAQVLKTKIIANIVGAKIPDFTIVGSRILSEGWLIADPKARGEDREVPKVEAEETLILKDISSEAKETQPPPRYSEAGLVKELEKRGIGRPSTYASIIRTIQDRGYVEKEGRALKPTDTGEVVSDFLSEHFDQYVGYDFTAEMENELDDIASGKRDYVTTLEKFYTPFQRDVKKKQKLEKATDLGKANREFKCPKCGRTMIIKLGKTGKFLSCSKFPDCTGARTISGEEIKGPEETGESCPKCETGKLVKRQGKFGDFVSCDQYPKCKFIKETEEEAQRKQTGVTCPMCNTGKMIERRGRFGVFYSCSEYPKCKNAIKAKPTGKLCTFKRSDRDNENCGALMMEGTKTIPDRCSDKTCPNHNPHKL